MGRKASGTGLGEGGERRGPKVGRSTWSCHGSWEFKDHRKVLDNLGQGHPNLIPFVFCKDFSGGWIS